MLTGATVQHILTAANLKNQPELVEKGLKIGDEILIVEPAIDEPLVGETAATKTTTEKPPVVKESKKKILVDLVEVPEKGNVKRAAEIAKAQNVEVVFENHKGEFFTSENLVRLSVGNDKSKIITHSF